MSDDELWNETFAARLPASEDRETSTHARDAGAGSSTSPSMLRFSDTASPVRASASGADRSAAGSANRSVVAFPKFSTTSAAS